MDNIQKLREKVEKDPKSTVFVRLAEELKKTGEVDEAIEVLKAGIERQPGYTSARVSLGKIYMDKDMTDEAKAEFMQVIETVPDNLFARKKLAEIYRTEGDTDLAIENYKQYLAMSPMDEEVQAICTELERGPGEGAEKPGEEKAEAAAEAEPVEPGKRPAPAMPEAAAPEPEEAEISAEEVYLETTSPEEQEAEGFMTSLADKEAGPEEEGEEEPLDLSLQEKGGGAPGSGVEFKGFDLEGGGPPETVSQNDIDSMIEDVVGVPEEEVSAEEVVEVAEEEPEEEAVGVVEIDETEIGEFELEGVPMGGEEEAVGVIEIEEGAPEVELEGFVEEVSEGMAEEVMAGPVEEKPVAPPEPPREAPPEQALPNIEERFAEADALVSNEDYVQAVQVYQNLLSHYPDHPEVRQRAEELRGLIKLLGKDKEIIEAKLLGFLDKVQRKKHEFFGSS